MKRLLCWILLLLCTFCACSRQDPVPVEPVLRDGIWTGTGEGRSGTILVKLTIKDQRITDIVVVNQSESSFAQETINEMVARALKKQALLSSEVDAISGATLTSNGMIDAINMALHAAMGQEDTGKTIYKDGSCDIVVIGAGGSGLTAPWPTMSTPFTLAKTGPVRNSRMSASRAFSCIIDRNSL